METHKRELSKKGRILRSSTGILLAAAVIFNMMSFEGITASASKGTESNPGLENDESSTFEDEPTEPEEKSEISEPDTEDEPAEPEEKSEISEPGTEDESTEPEEKSEPTEPDTEDESTEPEEKSESTEPDTEDEPTEPDTVQTELAEPVGMFAVQQFAVYALKEKTQEPKVTGNTDDLDFSNASVPGGDLDADNYHWEGSPGGYKLTLKDISIRGTVTLPDDTVTIETIGSCSVSQLAISGGSPDKTKLIFSGGGELSINERINLSGGDNNTITVETGAKVIASNGIEIGASGGINSVVTINGTLTVKDGGSANAIYAGVVNVGGSGILNVSGTNGVVLNGRSSNDRFKDVFIVSEGGCFTADCTTFNIRVSSSGQFGDTFNADEVINVPAGYMPADCGVKKSDVNTIILARKSTGEEYTGQFTIRSCIHEHTEIRGQKDADCTAEGNMGDTYCIDCNTKISSGKAVPALGHDWHITSDENEKRIYTCSRCGTTREEEVQKPPQSENEHSHSYKEDILENATCTKEGTVIYTCDCGASYTKNISALGHKYIHKVTIGPTIFTEGVMTYTCSHCGHQYTESIPMLAQHEHTYIAMVLREAACTEEGIRIYACACGDTYTESIPMLAHSYESKITREPTASSEGVMTYTCSNTYTKPIDKIESTLTKTDSRPKSSNPSIHQ